MFVILDFPFDVDEIWRTDPALEIWTGAAWVNSLRVAGRPSSKQIAYKGAQNFFPGDPWRIITRPNSFVIRPYNFELPQLGTTIGP